MSKAFDTVLRDKLLEHLEKILNQDELHLLSLLTNRPTLKVKLEESEGEPFETYMGIMQGDCLSAVLFIFYLAECLDEENEYTMLKITVFNKHLGSRNCACNSMLHISSGDSGEADQNRIPGK